MGALDSFKNIHAWFETTIPSTNETIFFRAMVMKENMEIGLALNENNASGLETVYTVLENCIKEDINVRSLQIFDVEWLLLQMQKKGQGETKTVSIECSSCKKDNDVNISISDLTVVNLDKSGELKKIDLGNETFLEIKYPSMEIKNLIEALDGQSEDVYMAALIEICALSISKVYNTEDVKDFEEVPLDDWKDFILGQDSKVLEHFSEFFKLMPKCVIESNWICLECKTENKTVISDINNFF